MTEHCIECNRDFEHKEAMLMHNQAKHPNLYKEPLLTDKQKKKVRNWVIALLVVGLIIFGTSIIVNKSPATAQLPADIPNMPIHWHPHLRIVIDGRETIIPKNIGLGAVHMPIHIHEEDNILHMENDNPTSETVRLGYFFKVWNKHFDRTCIFEYCTDKGTLKMSVNGKENSEFESYVMHDKDEILIEYTTRGNT